MMSYQGKRKNPDEGETMQRPTPNAVISVRIPIDLLEELRDQAERERRSLGSLLKLAGVEYLDRQRRRTRRTARAEEG
jgi:hypothetical protein